MPNPNPVPTQIKILRGNPGKKALPKHELTPVPLVLPPAPDYLIGYAREEWDRLMRELAPYGIVSAIDTHQLAAYCTAYDRWRRTTEELQRLDVKDFTIINKENGRASQNPLLIAVCQQGREMLRLACEFGFTPVARTRLSTIESKPKASKFAGLLAN
jgi:P27 family predicted phage terminase small subunit